MRILCDVDIFFERLIDLLGKQSDVLAVVFAFHLHPTLLLELAVGGLPPRDSHLLESEILLVIYLSIVPAMLVDLG